MKLIKKLWFDENSMPPKNMIWYRGHGKFYEYSNGKWIVIYDLSNNLSQEELDSVIDKIKNEGKELQDESLFGVLNTIVDSLSSGGSVTDVIKYIPQELTAEQKEQALTNIGAASQSSLVQVNNRAIDALSNSSSAANMAANAESKSNLAIQYVEAVPVTRGDGLNSVRQAGESSTSHPFSKGARSCAFGKLTTSLGDNSHTEGGSSNLAPDSITTSTSDEDIKSSWESKKFLMAKGQNAHAEGNNCLALANHTHAEGNQAIAEGGQAHAEGYQTKATGVSSHAENRQTTASGTNSHAEGQQTEASGTNSHTEGQQTEASEIASHAEGQSTVASAESSHAEGYSSEASGNYSHAEGLQTTASAESSHAEGYNTKAEGVNSHVEGSQTIASGDNSHAEGSNTKTEGTNSHAEGNGTETKNQSEHAEGQYNKSNKAITTFGDAGNTQHSIGMGTSPINRKNAFEVMQNGDIYVFGIGDYDGTNIDTAKTLQQVIADITSQLN